VNLPEYREQIGRIPYGKRLPTALYVHREGLVHLGGSLGAVLDRVVARYQVSTEFNLVKFRTDELKLSFLAYPDFESDPHPALRHAIAIDLTTGKGAAHGLCRQPQSPHSASQRNVPAIGSSAPGAIRGTNAGRGGGWSLRGNGDNRVQIELGEAA
jgi:hypothetical protein